jgi:hypothetical protein
LGKVTLYGGVIGREEGESLAFALAVELLLISLPSEIFESSAIYTTVKTLIEGVRAGLTRKGGF